MGAATVGPAATIVWSVAPAMNAPIMGAALVALAAPVVSHVPARQKRMFFPPLIGRFGLARSGNWCLLRDASCGDRNRSLPVPQAGQMRRRFGRLRIRPDRSVGYTPLESWGPNQETTIEGV